MALMNWNGIGDEGGRFDAPMIGDGARRSPVVAGSEDSSPNLLADLTAHDPLLRQLSRLSQAGIWVLDAGGRTLFASQHLGDSLACAPEALVGRPLSDFADATACAAIVCQVEADDPTPVNVRLTADDGKPRWVNITAGRLAGTASGAAGTLLVLADITAQKRAEVEARLLLQAVEMSPNAIVITNREGRIEYANPQVIERTGYTSEELKGQTPAIFKSGKTPPDVYQSLWSTILSGQVWRGELLNRRRNGELHWEAETIGPLFNEDGTISGFLAIKCDVTDRRAADASLQAKSAELQHLNDSLEALVAERTHELELARQAAEAANRAKSMFLANMSHEIRTPMNAILGFTELLHADRALPEQSRRHLDTIVRSGHHLMGLLNNILEMSRIEAGRIEPRYEALDADSACRDMVEIFRPRAREKGLHIALAWGEEVPAMIESDPQKVREVLHNLLSNAIKFTTAGSITLRSRLDGAADSASPRVLFEVTDTGCGISTDEQAMIFDAFAQVGSSEMRAGGTGLGLSISRSYAHMLGGELSVHSTPGGGSTFTLDLPLRQVDSSSVCRDSRPAPRHLVLSDSGPAPLVLVVDDVTDNRELLVAILARSGFRTRQAASAEEALELLEQLKPAAALVDLRMPGMNGFELLSRLREHPDADELIALAVSASAQPFVQQRALDHGFAAFIPKPIDAQLMVAELARLLNLAMRTDDGDRDTCSRADAEVADHGDGSMAKLPPDLRRSIATAAEQCDHEALVMQADELDSAHPGAARWLRQRSDGYEYERIRAAASLQP